MGPVEQYIRHLVQIHSTGAGTGEASFYPPLNQLLDAAGKALTPRVNCIMQLKDLGADHPDGGLFTAEQSSRTADKSAILAQAQAQAPARGAVEVKSTRPTLDTIMGTPQVRKYLDRYNQVLITNLRGFLVVTRNDDGKLVEGERYELAPSEAEFWKAAANPEALAAAHGEPLIEFLKRVIQRPVPLASPRDLAWYLASYARDARSRLDRADMRDLATIRSGFEEALGLTFEDERGESFFRSTLAQTLFYGLFSAWVLWTKTPDAEKPFDTFSWKGAVWSLSVPTIRALYEQLVTPRRTARLDIAGVLNWAEETLNRVDPTEFFKRFEEEHAVQYFYEPFLQAFDPELRKQLGVWYTPPEIVRYMVARVDTVLRTELGIENGLADPNVYVLDPCCGTGAYVVETLRHIHATHVANGMGALAGQEVKKAAINRVFGFEILPAPFVVAHLQLGLLLQSLGAPLADDDGDSGERAAVYLTNALTGWEPPEGVKRRLPMPEFEEERDAAEKVKRATPILVVLGNPPYNAYAGTSPEEERGLVEPYKDGLRETWGIKKYNLDDLYVRFFRIAERRIAEATGRGVVCYISNYSYLSDPSFVVMRQQLMKSFDEFWIEDLHGNRKISEYAPDGRTSETVFAIRGSSEGIQTGVAITLMARRERRSESSRVRFRGDLDDAKAADRRQHLLASLDTEHFDTQYQTVTPSQNNRFSFRPNTVSDAYYAWPQVAELAGAAPMPGLLEKRKGSLVSMDRAALEARMRTYLDPSLSWESVRSAVPGLSTDAARFDAKLARTRLVAAGPFDPSSVRRMMLIPMDTRWCYHTTVRPIWNEPRPEYSEQIRTGIPALVIRKHAVANPEGLPFFYASILGNDNAFLKHAYYVPLMLRLVAPAATSPAGQTDFLDQVPEVAPFTIANLSDRARAYLAGIGVTDPDQDMDTAALVWRHVLAIGYAPAYLAEHEDGIRADWPRIPLPTTETQLRASAALGRQLAALLDTEQPAPGVTGGRVRPELAVIASLAKLDGSPVNPAAGDFDLRARWGYAGANGIVMGGAGRLTQRAYTSTERAAIETGALALGLSLDQALDRLGHTTVDLFVNDRVVWQNVPSRVWEFTIGGYQVIKKWLSYREYALLDRPLTLDEVQHVIGMARRLAAVRLLEPALDANYAATTADTYPWPATP